MAIETKIKEAKETENFPALYSSDGRASVILVLKDLGNNKLEGVVMHPYRSFGQYSITWSASKYSRMPKGSELSFKFTQE